LLSYTNPENYFGVFYFEPCLEPLSLNDVKATTIRKKEMSRQVTLIFLFASVLFAQNKIDSLFLFSHKDYSDKIQKNIISTPVEGYEKLPLQYFLFQVKMNFRDDKFLASNKILLTELTESYTFSKEELNSGLSEDQLISYLKNKKTTLKILADDYHNHTDVNWDKIGKVLGISKTALAFILALISVAK
jgi:hypothetical protein